MTDPNAFTMRVCDWTEDRYPISYMCQFRMGEDGHPVLVDCKDEKGEYIDVHDKWIAQAEEIAAEYHREKLEE